MGRDNVAKSKKISLFLLDGTANGRIKCSINSRNEIIYKIPRKALMKCKGRDELDNAGVYMLIGEEGGGLKIYVGQAGGRKNGKGLLNRLSEQDRSPDKNFWSEAIVLTMADNSFGATEISWLEHKFCDLAIKAARCSVMNGNDPSPGNITEEKESDLEDHVEFAQLILSAIGYKIFEPQQKKSSPPAIFGNEEIFILSRKIKAIGRTVTAYMKRTPTGYKVLAGSEISPTDDGKRSIDVKHKRCNAKIDTNGKLLEDVEFMKPSPAAEFVLGMSADGKQSWKLKGVPLKNILQGGN